MMHIGESKFIKVMSPFSANRGIEREAFNLRGRNINVNYNEESEDEVDSE